MVSKWLDCDISRACRLQTKQKKTMFCYIYTRKTYKHATYNINTSDKKKFENGTRIRIGILL